MLEDFYNAVGNNQNIDVIYIDLKKAFDTVPINLLLTKVKNAGISGKIFEFIKHFVTGRSYCVKINDSFSKSFCTYSGDPQGSVFFSLSTQIKCETIK
uniref:Reverse transcriptase domain-containing protein n=1 Tax=Meloidogyne enterolobii TaxID=390850 RepID=A0A6V7Y2P9_MELEN|nr:unnamed protein product [Meloidogyne enterolobii]